MPTQRELDRGLAVRKYGSSCYCCGLGPLSGHYLFLAPIGSPDVACAAEPSLAPVCGRCSKALKVLSFGRHLDRVRRDAKFAMAATRQRAIEFGRDVPFFSET